MKTIKIFNTKLFKIIKNILILYSITLNNFIFKSNLYLYNGISFLNNINYINLLKIFKIYKNILYNSVNWHII